MTHRTCEDVLCARNEAQYKRSSITATKRQLWPSIATQWRNLDEILGGRTMDPEGLVGARVEVWGGVHLLTGVVVRGGAMLPPEKKNNFFT